MYRDQHDSLCYSDLASMTSIVHCATDESQQPMPGPSFVFAFMVATLFGSAFHLIVGGGARHLALYLLSGWIGFALGQSLGDLLGISVVRIGQINFVAASLGALLALIAARIFSSERPSSARR